MQHKQSLVRKGLSSRSLALLLVIMLGLGLAQIAQAALVWQRQTVDSTGNVGEHTSLVLDSSGNPVISYYDSTNLDLKLIHCGNADCSSSSNSIMTVDSVGQVGLYTSLVLDSSGNPVISYFDAINGDLKLAHCGDANCSGSNSVQTVDNSSAAVGIDSSLVLDSSGNPVISYYDINNGDLKLVHCGDPNCTSSNIYQTVDNNIAEVGRYTSLALDSSGNPVISYMDITDGDLEFVHCGNPTCTSGNIYQTVDSSGFAGVSSSLVLDSSGSPVISYRDSNIGDLKLAHCGDANCSSSNSIQTVDSDGFVGLYNSLALDSSGKPVISYYDDSNGDLKLVYCGDATCSSGNNIQTVDSIGDVGINTSLVLDGSGNPVISYLDISNFDLKVASLLVIDSTPPTAAPTVSSGTLGNNGWYTSDVVIAWNWRDGAGGSGIGSSCTTTSTTLNEGTLFFAASCTDHAGNIGYATYSLMLDKSKPTLSPAFSPNPLRLGGAGVVSAGAADAISGLATQGCGALDTLTVGVKSVICTASDNAGNSDSVTVNYSVHYHFNSLFPIVNAGAKVAINFNLGGNQGLTILAAGSPTSQPVACATLQPTGVAQPTLPLGAIGLTYNAQVNQYTYSWQTDKTWANTCRQFNLLLNDGSAHIAYFQFGKGGRSAEQGATEESTEEGAEENVEEEAAVEQVFLPLVNQ